MRRPGLGFANAKFAVSMRAPDIKRERVMRGERVDEFHISPEMLKENGLPPRPGPGERVALKSAFIPPNVLPAFFLVVTVVAISTTYRFMIDRVKLNNIEQERRNEHLKSELTFLRSQISPHFIFNILNSAVSLSRINSDQLEPTLIKLSSLMRYMLYGADDEKVPLTQEIDYLESYIDLQKLRFGDDVPITFNRSGALFGHGIEPMLLIPFVENAFKHGVGEINNPSISVDVEVEDGTLHFRVVNRFNPDSREIKDPQSGIGLANVKKRLNLLYGENHTLDITEIDNLFEVHLKLLLK
jgi:LytS/YehU family sensor histidine kinase